MFISSCTFDIEAALDKPFVLLIPDATSFAASVKLLRTLLNSSSARRRSASAMSVALPSAISLLPDCDVASGSFLSSCILILLAASSSCFVVLLPNLSSIFLTLASAAGTSLPNLSS